MRRPLGVLAMDIDPAIYRYPSLSRWPISSRTADTLLVRKDGDDVLFLNEVRFQKNAPFNLRVPLTKTDAPTVKAVLGHRGIAHGVGLTVESAPGKGSVFCAILPYVKPVALIVDDDELALSVLGEHLGRIGVDVIPAVDGEKAIEALKEGHPHIIITDINMPEMDGFALLAALSKIARQAGYP
jgi:hypothetical protein